MKFPENITHHGGTEALRLFLCLFLVLFCVPLGARDMKPAHEDVKSTEDAKPAVVPITQEEHHHLVLENEYVRVFHVVVPPHSETKFHQHDMDYVFVTLGNSVVESERVGEKPVKLELKDGDTRFTKGGFAHKAVNLSDKPFVNVTVELKKAVGSPGAKNDFFDGLITCSGTCRENLVVTNGLRCSHVFNIDPQHYGVGVGGRSNKLLIMLTEGRDKDDGKILNPGDILWKTGEVEVLTVKDPDAKRFPTKKKGMTTSLAAVVCDFAPPGDDFLNPESN